MSDPKRACGQVPITIDDDFRIRVLEPEQAKKTEQLAEDCKGFVDSECGVAGRGRAAWSPGH